MDVLIRIVAGTVGGFIGGALAGLAEAGVIAATGGAEEYGVFVFGSLAYGLFGAAMGAGWGLATSRLRFLGADKEAAFSGAAAVVVAALGFVVARFRLTRDVFGESLPLLSAKGLAVNLGLAVLALVVLLLLRAAVVATVKRAGLVKAATGWAVTVVGLGVVLTLGLNAVSVPPKQSFPPATAQGPNVMLIIADTLRPDYIGPYGGSMVKTPALDALAADSVVFENAFAESSWTRPSVSTILTSLYAASHRVMYKTDLLPEQVTTLAEALLAAGYRTSGYVTNINVAPSFQFQQGYQEYSYLAPEFFFGATDSGSKLSLYSGMRLIRERFLSSAKYVENYYQDAETLEAAASPWLEENSKGAFFTTLHFMDPHDPYFEIPYNGVAVARVDTPNPLPAQTERLEQLYAANIAYLDGFLGKLFTSMKEAGVYDNTVIAFVADHGEEFHEHGGWWHGTTLYDEQIHVPVIVKLPRGEKAGTRVGDFARLLDVAPTLLAAASVPAPPAFQGRDLFGPDAAPTSVYAQEDHEGNEIESLRSERWKLILANEGNPRGLEPVELYDLSADPHEKHNRAEEHPDVVAGMRRELEAMREIAGSHSVAEQEGELDDAAKERLRALGYIE